MTQACRALLERIKHDREEEPAMESVMRVHEAQKSLDRGLETLSLPRITHHDLRNEVQAALGVVRRPRYRSNSDSSRSYSKCGICVLP